jgi:hypothetical protein
VRRRAVWLVLASIVACTEVGTDPQVPVALEIDAPALPAIGVGDSLRDTTGAVATLVARALNSQNEIIPDAPIRFSVLRNDSIVTIDSLTGQVVGLEAGEADVVARVDGLQSVRIVVRVTSPPDTVSPVSELVDSVRFAIADDTARALSVRVARDTTINGQDTLVGVQFWRVRYTIVDPPDLGANTDTTRVYIANESNRLSRIDTTDVNGVASRRVRFPLAAVSDTTRRTFVTEVVVLGANGAPLPGSPILFTTVLRLR